jgi:hypothetical protein
MQQSFKHKKFRRLSADYFVEKAKKVKGPEKFLVALEKSKYLSEALKNGLSFTDLKELGFKFATV